MSVTNVTDLNGLEQLKITAKKEQSQALPEVARQFEALFIQSMLKSMRKAGESFKPDNLFQGKDKALFEEMMDNQLSLNMANERGIGLAAVLIQQMEQFPGASTTQEMAKIEQQGKILPAGKAMVASADSFDDAKDFVKTLWPHAKKIANKMGLDPKLLIAQAALETGWGKFVASDRDGESSNNLFNIKARKKEALEAVEVETKEFIGGEFRKVVASFKKYDDYAQSFTDYQELISNHSRYRLAMEHAKQPDQFIQRLHQAGYATDPHYADKVLSIYRGGELADMINELEVN